MLITFLVTLPLVGAVVVVLIPARLAPGIRVIALVAAVSTLGLATLVVVEQARGTPGDTARVVFEAKIEEVLDQVAPARDDPQRQDLQAILHALPAAPSGKDVQLLSERVTLRGQTHLELYDAALEYALATTCPTAAQVRQVVLVPWIDRLGVNLFLGVDGLSLPLVWLASLLGVIVVLAAWHLEERAKQFHVLNLIVLAGLLGVLVSLDALVLVMAWSLVLVPAYFLLGAGDPRRGAAAMKYIIFGLIGSSLLLLVVLACFTTPADINTYNLLALTTLAGDGRSFTVGFQAVAFLVLLAACAIRLPIFPFHTWFPDAVDQAEPPVAMLLTGLAGLTGGYVLVRLGHALCPDVLGQSWAILLLGGLGLITMYHGALCAFAHTALPRRFAYAVISQLGLLLVGLASLTGHGLQGSLLHLCALSVTGPMLFLLVGLVHERTGSRDLTQQGGLATRMPLGSMLATLGLLSLVGVPGLAHGVAFLLIVLGGWSSYEEAQALSNDLPYLPRGLVVITLVGLVLTAGHILQATQRLFLGPAPPPPEERRPGELRLHEGLALVPLALLCLTLGLWPGLFLRLLGPAADAILGLVHR
jgi:NADH-quinone oxidoreductase subunit M